MVMGCEQLLAPLVNACFDLTPHKNQLLNPQQTVLLLQRTVGLLVQACQISCFTMLDHQVIKSSMEIADAALAISLTKLSNDSRFHLDDLAGMHAPRLWGLRGLFQVGCSSGVGME